MSTFVFRKHQPAAVDAAEFAIASGIRRPLLNSCVGSGKSFIYAELARRAVARGERVIIGAHVRELVEQNAEACRVLMPDVDIGINAAALEERVWRAPVICASIQSVFKNGRMFGEIDRLIVDEAHLLPFTESGMYIQLHRDLKEPPMIGGSGTPFRLQGGSLIEGEGAPFERVVYTYSIVDGIRDGYLVTPVSLKADDQIDASQLRTDKYGEYTQASQDDQMIKLIDNHILQMVYQGQECRGWLIFEASVKAARAMHARLNQWGIPTGIVLGTTPATERTQTVESYRKGQLRALVNVTALTTGFDVQHVDLLVMRRRTQSLGLYIQMLGRCLRTIGGNIESSTAAGKPFASVLDFAGNINQHGPLDCIEPRASRISFIECDVCKKRNPPGATKCWACGEELLKNCPACLAAIPRPVLDCPCCGFDLRQPKEDKGENLYTKPSGAALLSRHRGGVHRAGGWVPIRGAWQKDGSYILDDAEGKQWELPSTSPLGPYVADARWIRPEPFAFLIGNGGSRNSAIQVLENGSQMVVPLPIAATGAVS